MDLRGEVLTKQITPFYFGQIGWGVGGREAFNGFTTETFEGRLYYQLGLGLKINTRKWYEWTLSVGYKYQNTYQELIGYDLFIPDAIEVPPFPSFINNWALLKGTREYGRITFQVGFGF